YPGMGHLARGQRVELCIAVVRGVFQLVEPRIEREDAVAARRAVDVLVHDAGIDDGVGVDAAADLDQERAADAALAADFCNVCEVERRHRDLWLFEGGRLKETSRERPQSRRNGAPLAPQRSCPKGCCPIFVSSTARKAKRRSRCREHIVPAWRESAARNRRSPFSTNWAIGRCSPPTSSFSPTRCSTSIPPSCGNWDPTGSGRIARPSCSR